MNHQIQVIYSNHIFHDILSKFFMIGVLIQYIELLSIPTDFFEMGSIKNRILSS